MMNSLHSDKKDIIFIQLELFTEAQHSFFNAGMLSIATLLKNEGYSVEYIKTDELASLNYESREVLFKKLNPKIVGFNINSDNIQNVAYWAKDIKKWIPGVIILLGGPLVSILKESVLNNPFFDMAISGEGEFPALKLCDKIIKDIGTYNDIPGLIYRDNNNDISMNPVSPPIKNLDVLPPIDYSFLHPLLSPGNSAFFYSSGRGCPFNCSFCFKGVHNQGYRSLSAERVVNDIITTCVKYGAKGISFGDDNFTSDPARVVDICTRLKEEKLKRNLDFAIWCECRIDIFYKYPYLISALKNAGLVKLHLGVENGNQHILDIYNKKITLEQIEFVLEEVAKTGYITSCSDIIIGGAFETEKTLQKTLDFTIKLMHMAPGFFEAFPAFLCPFPKTDIAENPEKYGITIIDNEWTKFLNFYMPSCETKDLKRVKLVELRNNFVKTIQNEMKKIIAQLDFDVVKFHYNLSSYGFTSFYANTIAVQSPAAGKYLSLWNNVSRLRLGDMPYKSLINSKPLRLIEPLYAADKNNAYCLSGYIEEIYIYDKEEKFIYDLSSGSFTVFEISELVKNQFDLKISAEEIINNRLIPFYKRLEKSYHIIFQI